MSSAATRTPDDLHATTERFLALPLYEFIGLRVVRLEPESELRIDVSETTMGFGHLHGGITYCLIDAAGYFACLPQLAPDQDAVTANLSVSLIRPAAADEEIVIRGRLVRRTKRTMFASAEALIGDQVIALGTVTKTIITTRRDVHGGSAGWADR